MLRCLIHILVSADPMSLVPPERQQNTVESSVHKTTFSNIQPKRYQQLQNLTVTTVGYTRVKRMFSRKL